MYKSHRTSAQSLRRRQSRGYESDDAQEVHCSAPAATVIEFVTLADPKIAAALETLLNNLKSNHAPETLISQAFTGLEFGDMTTDPTALIERTSRRVAGSHAAGCGAAYILTIDLPPTRCMRLVRLPVQHLVTQCSRPWSPKQVGPSRRLPVFLKISAAFVRPSECVP